MSLFRDQRKHFKPLDLRQVSLLTWNTLSCFYKDISRSLENEDRQTWEVLPSTAIGSAPLSHCHTVATLLRCRRLKPGRWSELPTPASDINGHESQCVSGRGVPSMFPHAGVSWHTLPGSRTNGLFLFPPWSCPLLPAPFGTDTRNGAGP